jgi:hypothetical protein
MRKSSTKSFCNLLIEHFNKILLFLFQNFSHDRCEKPFYPFTYHNYIGIELFYLPVG